MQRLGNVKHAVFGRRGGYSRPPYGSLNLGLHVGDRSTDVLRNRRLAFKQIALSPLRAVCAEQVHGSKIAVVGDEDAGRGADTLATAVPGVDGLLTRARDLALTAFFADCLPVLIADRLGEWVGIVHAGWRGTVAGVTGAAIAELAARGVGPERLQVALGPCIKPCCFEVGCEVTAQFQRVFGPETCQKTSWGSESVDLALANRKACLDSGLTDGRIDVASECTYCRTDLYFSHRAHGPQTGRMAAAIALKW